MWKTFLEVWAKVVAWLMTQCQDWVYQSFPMVKAGGQRWLRISNSQIWKTKYDQVIAFDSWIGELSRVQREKNKQGTQEKWDMLWQPVHWYNHYQTPCSSDIIVSFSEAARTKYTQILWQDKRGKCWWHSIFGGSLIVRKSDMFTFTSVLH